MQTTTAIAENPPATDMAQLTPDTAAYAPAPPANGKYRFWLSFTSLWISILFGILGVLSFATGQALSHEHTDPAKIDETVFLFNMVGTFVLGITVGCLFLAYKLRPGGE